MCMCACVHCVDLKLSVILSHLGYLLRFKVLEFIKFNEIKISRRKEEARGKVKSIKLPANIGVGSYRL